MDTKGSSTNTPSTTRLRILSRNVGLKGQNSSKSPPVRENNEPQGSPKSFRIYQPRTIETKGVLDISSRKQSQPQSQFVFENLATSPTKLKSPVERRTSGFNYVGSLASSPRAGVLPISEIKEALRGQSPQQTQNQLVTNTQGTSVSNPQKMKTPTNVQSYKEKLGRYLRSKPGLQQSPTSGSKLDSSGFLNKKGSSPLNNISEFIQPSNHDGGSPKPKENKTLVGFVDAHLNTSATRDNYIGNPSRLPPNLIPRMMASRGAIEKTQLDTSTQLRIEIKPRDPIVRDNREDRGHRVDLSQSPSNSHLANGTNSPRQKLLRLKDGFGHTPIVKQDEEDILARVSKSPEPFGHEMFKAREESTRPTAVLQNVKWSAPSWPRIEEEIRVDKLLGQGSFAKVYQGIDLHGKANVAIKILDKRKISELGFQKMVEKEIEIIQLVQQQYICRFERMLEDAKRVEQH